jgi:hypothetical protein
VYLLLLATLPALGLGQEFAHIQKINGLVGAGFVVLLGVALLILNNRRSLVGKERAGVIANVGVACGVGITGVGLALEIAALLR